tara:strand:- start:3361 stop:4095 length:735 start_codon:yes stop_codon:yes gene_type:complete
MIPNYFFSSQDKSSEYATQTGALLEFRSMISGKSVIFKAFLTDFSQNFASTWNSENVFGRMDPIATYDNTTRTINVGWSIPAYDLNDAKNNLHKCSSLIQMLYPSYSETNTFSPETGETITATAANSLAKPPLLKLKFANLISTSAPGTDDGLLGYTSGINWAPQLDQGMFVHDGKFYPKVISLSCDFNVLHQENVIFNNESQLPGFPFNSDSLPVLEGTQDVSAAELGLLPNPISTIKTTMGD